MKRRNAVCIAIGALAVAAAPLGCGGSSGEPVTSATALPASLLPDARAPGLPALSPAAGDAITGALTQAVAEGQTPGVVALVVNRDGILFEGGAGQQDVGNQRAMPVDAIFNIASMTKPVTSVAILRLYEQGRLGLDEPVSTYLSGYDALEVITSIDLETGEYVAAPATTPMTVRHLLSHTSGIGYGFCNTTVARLQQATQRSELELPLLNEPGAKWNYSASTRVLGLIVEAVTGQSLEDYFQAEIFEPLGMADTSYAVPAEKQARVPTLHVRAAAGALQEAPQNGVPSDPTPPFTGDGGLYSTAQDYGRFMRMFLGGGALGDARILRESSVAMMGENQIGGLFVELQEAANPMLTQPFPLGAGQDKFGLGFQISMNADGGAHRSVGSLAWAGLFNTEFWIDPQQGIAATLLMQVLPFYDDGAIQTLQAFEATVYRELTPRQVD